MGPPTPSLDAMAALQRFRSFFSELHDVTEMLGEDDRLGLLKGGPSTAARPEEQLYRAVQLRLRRAIAAQDTAYGSTPMTTRPAADRPGPGYILVAVADEVLLRKVSWPAQDLWADTPLEETLYRSRIAGDRVFEACDALLARRAADPEGLGVTILLALQTGFRGRYADASDPEIERRKANLYELVFHTPYIPADNPVGLVAGQAEPFTVRHSATLPSFRPWLLATGGVIVLYLVLSFWVWTTYTSRIADAARCIQATYRLSDTAGSHALDIARACGA